MIVFIFAAIAFFFLVLGAAAFTLCAGIPWRRRYALSSALWFAVWGPCICSWLMTAVADGIAMDHWQWKQQQLPVPASFLGGAFALFALVATILLATAAALIHQALIVRMTLALFRIYAAVVSAGVGSIWGWCLLVWLGVGTMSQHVALIWLPGMFALCVGFAYFGLRFAKGLRGCAPERFTWITKAEFEGVDA